MLSKVNHLQVDFDHASPYEDNIGHIDCLEEQDVLQQVKEETWRVAPK